jgi:hypothetical protein
MLGVLQTESEVGADYIGLSKHLKGLMNAAGKSLFHDQPQSLEGLIPLTGNCFQRTPRFG